MTLSSKGSLAALGFLAATALSFSPAHAAQIVNCASTTGQCIETNENILLDNGTNQTSVTGTTQDTGVSVLFTSTGNNLNSASGQAVVSATDGLLENLTFTLLNGATFQTAFFNITPLTGNDPLEATSVFFTFSDGSTSNQLVAGSGNNQFGLTADAGVGISSVTFVSMPTGTGVDSLRQLRLGGVSTSVMGGVPEPSTWAMLLIGFGGVGFSMRRARAKRSHQLQLA